MKQITLTIIFSLSAFLLFSQSVTGHWKTIDDRTGKTRSVVHIYEESNGTISGKITKLFQPPNEDQDPVCDACDEGDPRHMQKVIGMVILKNMKRDGNECSGGMILDPEAGSDYRCKIWTEGNDILKVRGYLGPFFRTQTWHRQK